MPLWRPISGLETLLNYTLKERYTGLQDTWMTSRELRPSNSRTSVFCLCLSAPLSFFLSLSLWLSVSVYLSCLSVSLSLTLPPLSEFYCYQRVTRFCLGPRVLQRHCSQQI